jgi:cytochrome c peroxidase
MRQDTRTLVRAAFATMLGILSVPLAGSPEVRAQTPPPYNPYPSGILPANLDSEIQRVRNEVQTIFGRYFAEW